MCVEESCCPFWWRTLGWHFRCPSPSALPRLPPIAQVPSVLALKPPGKIFQHQHIMDCCSALSLSKSPTSESHPSKSLSVFFLTWRGAFPKEMVLFCSSQEVAGFFPKYVFGISECELPLLSIAFSLWNLHSIGVGGDSLRYLSNQPFYFYTEPNRSSSIRLVQK